MTEFSFEGGYQGPSPSFHEHYGDRERGFPKIGNVVPLPRESKQFDEHTRPAPVATNKLTSDPVPEREPVVQEIAQGLVIGSTVWLELSGEGPFKVVGRYDKPAGAEIPARHPHDADNVYEKVRVIEGLWLCQDAKGKVHILAGGSLTLDAPKRWTSSVRAMALQAWAKREVVLWLAAGAAVGQALLRAL